METKWISVKERLPGSLEKDGFEQLVSFDEPFFGELEKRINVAYYDEDSNKWYSDLTGRELLRVTHWMPLPEPPKI